MSGKGFYLSIPRRWRIPGGGSGRGEGRWRVQKSVTKWSLIACKTAPRSDDPEPRRCASRSLRAPCAYLGVPGWRCASATGPSRAASPLRRRARAGPLGLACPGRMRPLQQEWGSEALIEFHKKPSESWGDFFFFLFFYKFTPAGCGSSGPTSSSQHIPFLGSVYTGKGLPGRLTSPQSGGCGARVEQSQAPAFSACCFSQFGRPPLGPAVGCQLPAASPPPVGTPAGMAPIRPIQSCRHPCPQPGPEGLSWKWMSLEGRASAFPYYKSQQLLGLRLLSSALG